MHLPPRKPLSAIRIVNVRQVRAGQGEGAGFVCWRTGGQHTSSVSTHQGRDRSPPTRRLHCPPTWRDPPPEDPYGGRHSSHHSQPSLIPSTSILFAPTSSPRALPNDDPTATPPPPLPHSLPPVTTMTRTATSPPLSRPTTTPAARPPTYEPGSVGQNMPPFLSSNPRASTPHNPLAPNVKSPSPNYFGSQDGNSHLDESSARQNWSPPSSAVRSTAAVSPSVVPLDQNPEFEAFRRQSEGKAFNLGAMGSSFQMSAPPSNKARGGRSASRTEQPREAHYTARQSQTLDPSSADVGRSPKRVLSPGSAMITEQERRASPASFLSEPERRTSKDATLDSQPKFALPPNKMPDAGVNKHRAETLPAKSKNAAAESEQALMVTAQHVVNLMESRNEQVLLLDLRVSTQYAKARISGALNLCIPTTLLKRPSFNVHKLADTFKDAEQRQKFERWRNSSYIIVYDASSSLLKDAQICVNTINKFRSEGYEGNLYILKGGFTGFSSRFSPYVEEGPDSSGHTTVEEGGPDVAPVIGGCPMPGLDKPANPFFGNIRQNMDLIGGVGQMPLSHPSKATQSAEREFPEWLTKAASKQDNGKRVANKFEGIEKREKKRMEEALSGKVQFGTPKKQHPNSNTVETNKVQIAGIEKGTKNRYNNIWPFEHSRVKLQGVPHHGCDYINASAVRSPWSNKKYISTQAPIPGTFNDFWNMIWQQDVRVIVMLTAEKEGAQVKAHNYWDKKSYGSLQLDFLSEKRASIEPSRIRRHHQSHNKPGDRPPAPRRTSTSSGLPLAPIDPKENKDEPYVIVRRFTLSHSKQPFEPMREITQLQYSSWPDFGAPAHPAHLLGLVEQTNAVARGVNKTKSGEPEPEGKRPVLVHCSAGCGRTGTFCTVDSVIDMLKRQKISRDEDEPMTGRDPTPMDIDSKSPPPPTPQSTKSNNGRKPSSTPRASTNNKTAAGGFFDVSKANPYEDATAAKSGSSPMREEGIDGGWVQRDDQDLVEKTVEDFRHQRISMVQSLRQYVLCYESVMEWIVEERAKRESP